MADLYDRADIYDLFDSEDRFKRHWQRLQEGKGITSLLDVDRKSVV